MKVLKTSNKITSYLDEIKLLYDFIDGVKSINDFVNKVALLSQKFAPDEDKQNIFKGDMLELLSEIFFAMFQADPAIGITNYEPVPLSEDYGVDAFGNNVIGDKCAIQVKFKSNPSELILWEDMAKTYGAGRLRHNIPLINNDTIFLFTTGNGITSQCQSIFGNKIRIINRTIIASKIDNNQTFWKEAEEMIIDTLTCIS